MAQQVSIMQSHMTLLTSIEKKCLDAREQCRKIGKHEKAKAFQQLAEWAEEEYKLLSHEEKFNG